MNQHTATTSRAVRRLAGIVLLGALGIACDPVPAGSGGDGGSTTPVESVSGAISSADDGSQTPVESVNPATPSAGPGPTGRPLPTPSRDADLAEADAALAELEAQLAEADRDLATQEGDL